MNGKQLTRVILLVLPIALAACTTPSTPTATPPPDSVPRFESTTCWFDEPPGQEVECGYLIVPEDRSQADGRTIRLAVARFKSDSSDPSPDPIVYLEGGPGGSPLRSLIGQFNVLFPLFLEERDLILIDQRGTGYSQPALDCPEYTDLSVSVLDENLSVEQSETLGNAVLLECRNRLVGEGVNLAAYNSAENAADLNDLRLTLGIDKWNLYGISYGTRLALTTMRDFPEGLRSVVIDSVVPLQSNLYTEIPANGARAFGALFEACAVHAMCSVDFPDLRAVFFDLVDRLDESPVTFPVKLPSGEETEMLLNGDGFMGIVFQSLYATPIIPYLPRLIYEVRDGNYSLAAALQSAFLEQLEDISYGMHYSVQCEEEVPFGTLDDLRASIAQYSEYGLFAGTGIFDLCRAWGTPAAEPVENAPVTSDVPTLVLSGQLDPITPPSWGELAAQTLPNAFYFELPNAGHGASLTGGDCPRDLVLEFFGDPVSRPDATCLTAEMTRVEYARPLDRLEVKLAPIRLDSMGFSSVAPEDWIEVAPGIHTPSGSLTDQTAILQQSAPVPAETFLRLLATQIEQSGAEAEFKEIDNRSRNGLDWTIFSAEVSIAALDLAMAESDGTTYLILLQSVVDEREVLYDLLFLPAVDALKPAGR